MAEQNHIDQADAHAAPVNRNQNLVPELDLLSENNYNMICVPLRKAALKGNWKAADKILRENSLTRSSIQRKAITRGHATLLHVAAGARRTTFVRETINSMEENDPRLLLRDRKGNNAFCFAAAAGKVKIAQIMLDRNPNLNLATVTGAGSKTPLYMAVMFGRNEMAAYLYDRTVPYMTQRQREDLFFNSVARGLYGFALRLLTDCPRLAVARDVNEIENENPLPEAHDVNENDNLLTEAHDDVHEIENENIQQETHDVNENENENPLPEAHGVNENENENSLPEGAGDMNEDHENLPAEVHDINENEDPLMEEAGDANENENENLPAELAHNVNEIENENGNPLAEAHHGVNGIENENLPQKLGDEDYETALHMLVRMSMTAEALKLVKSLWDKIKQGSYDDVFKIITRPTNLLFDAAEVGNSEFLAMVYDSHPDLIYLVNDNKLSIFHIAIAHRHAKVFKLIYDQMVFDKELLTSYVGVKDGNNLLHLAAKYPDLAPLSIVPGAALEFLQEIQMFEVVERMMQPSMRDQKNMVVHSSSTPTVGHSSSTPTESHSSTTPTESHSSTTTPTEGRSSPRESHSSTPTENIKTIEGYTPRELFSKTHNDLKEEGEKWMKSTAKSCMLVATLIATVVFAAAFTVPGGQNQESGIPIHLHKPIFKVFAVSDAIALSSSSISIMLFLSILISRYEEEDFRMRLPLKLMLGLLSLFISVLTMMIAFAFAFLLFFREHERKNWITILVAAILCLPVVVYLLLHCSLLKDIICSTLRRNRFKPNNCSV